MKINKRPFAIILYSNIIRVFNKKVKGLALGFIVIIDKDCKSNKALLQHELMHVNQWYESFGLFPILYLFRKYRLDYELDAYAMSILHSSTSDRDKMINHISDLLSSNIYNLNISKNTAKNMLLMKLKELKYTIK